MTFNFKDWQWNSMTFQAWKITFLNSMTFQVFHDLYKPWMNNLLVMFAVFSSHGLTCGVTKNCLLKHPTAVEGIKMTKPCKILFNKTRFQYKLENLFQITHNVLHKWAPRCLVQEFVTSVTHSVNFAICSKPATLPLFFIVEMVTVQFDMLLLLHSMLGERKLNWTLGTSI